MFISVLITSSLAIRLKNHASQSAVVVYKTKILLDASQVLQQAKDKNDIMKITANQIIKLMHKDVVTYCIENGKLEAPKVILADENNFSSDYLSESEKTVALWVLKNNKHVGATTQTLSNSKCLYLAARINQNV